MGQYTCDALLGLHTFTGYDTVSDFSDRGKLGALKLLMDNEKFKDAFPKLGVEWQLTMKSSNS